MTDRSARRRCAELAGSVVLRDPFDLDDLVAQVAALRARPIRLLPMEGGAWHEVCGAWVEGGAEDYIFVDPLAGGVHREHIVLHELAHMLFDHRTHPDTATEPATGAALGDLRELLPDLDPAAVHRVLARGGYLDDSEREAELLASMLRGRAPTTPVSLNSSARQESVRAPRRRDA